MVIPVRKIVTHENPHLDEEVALWLLKSKFGNDQFPGACSAPVDYWSTGGKTADGRSWQTHEGEGTLLIGIGGGRFDEHPASGNGRKADHCAATLVAEHLGINQLPELQPILRYVCREDLRGGSAPFELAPLVKLLNEIATPEQVMEWTFRALDAKYEEQHLFFQAIRDFHAHGRVHNAEVLKRPGISLRVGVITSGNSVMSKATRSDKGFDLSVLIQRQPDGHVQIFTSQRQGLTSQQIDLMATRVRRAEMVKEGKILPDQGMLDAEGRSGTDRWWYARQGGCLLNGSLTATDVPTTLLLLEELTEIVLVSLLQG